MKRPTRAGRSGDQPAPQGDDHPQPAGKSMQTPDGRRSESDGPEALTTLGVKRSTGQGAGGATRPGVRARFLSSSERRAAAQAAERAERMKPGKKGEREGASPDASSARYRGEGSDPRGRRSAAGAERAGRVGQDRPARKATPVRADDANAGSGRIRRNEGPRASAPGGGSGREEREKPGRDRSGRGVAGTGSGPERQRAGAPVRRRDDMPRAGTGAPRRQDGRDSPKPEAPRAPTPAVTVRTSEAPRPQRASLRGDESGRDAKAADRRRRDGADRAHGEPPTGVRLSKVMAGRGLCSRREADEIIERGWVFVDGQRVSELGVRIDPDAQITLAPQAKRQQAEQVTILLHKPVGYVSGQPEPGFEPAVALIGPDNQYDRDAAQRFHASHLKGLAPAGRLDIDSTGLLVLTQNGRIARQLIGDDSTIDKEYLVRVEGRLDERGLALLNHGLELDGHTLRPAKVEWLNEDQLRFVLREGRKRQIRRMCELVGLKVVGLKRVRIGRVRLGDLPLGQWRFLREDESFQARLVR